MLWDLLAKVLAANDHRQRRLDASMNRLSHLQCMAPMRVTQDPVGDEGFDKVRGHRVFHTLRLNLKWPRVVFVGATLIFKN